MGGDKLPNTWGWSTLGEVADPDSKAIVSGPFGSNIGSRFFVEKGVPVIRGNNLTTDMTRFVDGGFVFVTEEKANELGNCDAVVKDLIFTAAGSLGQVGIIPDNTKYSRYIISNKQLRARVDKRRVDPLFAFYWFSSKEMVQYIQQRNTGSSVPLINLSVLRSLPLPLPPLTEQRAIAHILGTLDDKIELNRRMNETLEAMARALFKSWFIDFLPVRVKMAAKEQDQSLLLPQGETNTWFVYAIKCNDGSLYIGQTEDLRQRWLQHVGRRGGRWTGQHPPVRVPYWERQPSRKAAVEREKWLKTGFGRKWLKNTIAAHTQTGDPVRAKAEGRDPGLPTHIADLFPDSFEDSELGEIPEGWKIVNLPKEIDFLEGPGLRNWQYKSKGIKFLNIRCIADGDLDINKANSISEDEFKKTYSHFALMEDDIVISTSGTLGRLAIVRSDHLPLMLNTSIIRMRGRKPVGLAYVWGFLQSNYFLEEMFAHASGSVQLNFGPIHLRKIKMVLPPDMILETFEEVSQPLIRKTLYNRCQSRTLAALRDALLPKLISGEIRVKDAEDFCKDRGL
jgi:restriction endonuclease S subunit/predicted GIY-YIG superfamily endonuclease